MSAMPLAGQEIEYPTADGQPMAETLYHQQVMIDLIEGLRGCYREDPDVWVGGNFFLCYEEGNPNAHVSPDVIVAKGVRKEKVRPNYLLWEEKPPSLVVAVTSKSAQREDQGKKTLYARLGVEELVLFDVLGEYLRPRLQGFALEEGQYLPLALEADGSLLSRTTDLLLKPEGKRLRLVDAVTGERILWDEELRAAYALAQKRAAEDASRRAAEARAAEEAVARRTAETKAAEEAAARRIAEARVAEEAAARRAEEAARRTAEEHLRALQEELNRLRQAQGG